MTELERLEMLVKHYENKEKKLISWIKETREKVKENINKTENYNLRVNLSYYDKALKGTLKRIEVFERTNNDGN